MQELDDRINLLAKVARANVAGADVTDKQASTDRSILMLAAASYGARPTSESTIPTGFDPFAAALFEAIIEGAYLVATADGVFDDEERTTFERVVAASTGGSVPQNHVADLVADLADQLQEDGLDRRVERLAEGIQREEQALEVLRIAALIAQVSDDVSDVERNVLTKIASACKLGEAAVDRAIDDVRASLRA
ncbi:MAG: tellurite resistance TerB family protein [Labilithrix sp.]|nr:tellurite resistance TerB family protein [Labilithrix sp.]MCW5813853.1 tellurite resistance TerB family protein [Labilithrix sp.]